MVNEWFNFAIFLLIIGNTAVIASYKSGQSEETAHVLDLCNLIFSTIFLVEMILKLLGLGFKEYLSDNYNILDAIIVAVSVLDISLQYSPVQKEDNIAISVIKSIRILRIFKLSRIWDSFREVMAQFKQSLIDVSSFSLLLLLFIFVFALFGMEMFAFTVFYDADGNVYMTQETI